MVLNSKALDDFCESDLDIRGRRIGCRGGIGAGYSIDTTNIKDPIVVFENNGPMFSLALDGMSKIKRRFSSLFGHRQP
jgi:hypothetical protein